MRAVVLERDSWTCRHCGRWGSQCDHVKPMHQGGAIYAMDNLQMSLA